MELLSLTDIKGNEYPNPTYSQVKEAYLELFRLKSYGRGNHVDIFHVAGEMQLEIYSQSIVLIDHLKFYDGPGGPAEILSIRYQEGTILPILEEAINLYQSADVDSLIKLLKTLPKPEDE